MKALLPLLTLIVISISSFAQTNISGSLFTNTQWTLSGSPYIISGNLVIFDGVELVIDPGVILRFEAGSGIELRGTLKAIGTATDSITFTSNISNPTKGAWNGIKVIGTSNPLGVGNQLRMEYVRESYANHFVDLDIAYHGPYIFKYCHFSLNHAVNYDGGMPATIFEYCLFDNNDLGLDYCQFDSRASHCQFINNTNGLNGIAIIDTCYFAGNTGIALSPYGATTGCKAENNFIGVQCLFNSVNNSFINNTIINNQKGVDIQSYFNGSINFNNNTICNNTQYNVKLMTNNNANLANNCWCTTDSASIRSGIYDGYVDNSFGLVSFLPIATSCPVFSLSNPSILSDAHVTIDLPYPNPFNQSIRFKDSFDAESDVYIFDIYGRKILQRHFKSDTIINTSALPEGIYFYEIKNSKGISSKGKLSKE